MNGTEHASNWRNFFVVLFGVVLLLLIGMFGYVYLQGWPWVDALYMTFISFSTVGFSEVKPLNPSGRIFTMFIVLGGVILLAMLSASVTSLLVRRQFIHNYRSKKMKDRIKKQKQHVVLCGAGETGKTVLQEFQSAGKLLIVIDHNEGAILEMQTQFPEMMYIVGDATKDEVLLEAKVEDAAGLITALSDDTDNLFVVISARNLNP